MKSRELIRFAGYKFLLLMICAGMMSTDLKETSEEERELALVRRHIPSVSVTNISQNIAQVGTSLYNGDTLRTDAEGYALILFMDQSVTRVRPESQLIIRGQVNRDRSSSTRIDVERGEVFMNVKRQSGGMVEIGTTTTVASVKGTDFGTRSTGYHWVEKGEIEVTAMESGRSATITDRMFARISSDGMDIETGELTDSELADLSMDYRFLDSDPRERTIRFRFMDENGQIREIELDYFEHDTN